MEEMERETDSKTAMLLWLLAVSVLAGLLRLIGLGSASLTMNEAENAVTALHLFEGGSTGQMLYALPTALMFKALGNSEFTARLFPALMGIFLSILPLLAYRKIGLRKAAILSFLLACDPVLLFWSKRADAVIPAITLIAAAVVLLCLKKKTASAVCFLLSLGGGERVWPAILILSLCLAIRAFVFKMDLKTVNFRSRDLFAAFLLSVLLYCAFGFFPGGLSGIGTGFVNSFKPGAAWAFPGLNAELAAVVLYCGIPLLLSVYRALREKRIPFLLISLAAGCGLLLWHGVIMLPWISLLLWYEASETLPGLTKCLYGQKGFAFYMPALVVCGAWSFFYFRLVELFRQTNGSEPLQMTWNGTVQTLPLTRFGGALLLTIVSALIIVLIVRILMGFVESAMIRKGITCGFLVVLSWGLLTGIWNAGGFDREGDHPASAHLKNTASVLNGAYTSFIDSGLFDLLSDTITKHGDFRNTNFGLNFIADDPMMAWVLRNEKGIRTTANLQSDLTGVDLMLDNSGASFESAGYVRTQQPWRGTMDWTRFSFQDWGKWLIFGDARITNDVPVTLWVRADFVFSSAEPEAE